MKITYIQHSGFVLEYEETVLIFDYYKGRLPALGKGRKIYVFSSHAHPDHFQEKIFDWAEEYEDITYILSDDIRADRQNLRIISMGPRQEAEVDSLKIRTFLSTDEGVAFLIDVKGKTIYHAGDLNWWHWEEESDAYNEMMRRKYQHEIGKMEGQKVDVAFVPLDPRQEEQYAWGMDHYMRHTDTSCVFPMHMWDGYDVWERLMSDEIAAGYKDKVMHITEDGQTFEI